MRLTLRTLLAYRDQVLEPKDAEILEQRFRESQTARNISDKISQLLANPVATPLAVDAVEFGLNPNDVASFLDDAMATDRVADMERKCLDNDALLSEVASCHQILVKTIRSPAPLSIGFRNRIVGLWNRRKGGIQSDNPESDTQRLRADASHDLIPAPLSIPGGRPRRETVESVSISNSEIETSRPSRQRAKKEIPNSLQRTDRQWIGSTLRLLVLLALLAVCVAQSLGPREQLRELLDRQTNDWSSVPMGKPSPEPTER
jgi:hypothetical protein